MIEIQKRMETRLQEKEMLESQGRRQLYDGLEAFWEGLRISRAVRQSLGFQLKVRLIPISYSTVFLYAASFRGPLAFHTILTRTWEQFNLNVWTFDNLFQCSTFKSIQLVHPVLTCFRIVDSDLTKTPRYLNLYSNPMLWSLLEISHQQHAAECSTNLVYCTANG